MRNRARERGSGARSWRELRAVRRPRAWVVVLRAPRCRECSGSVQRGDHSKAQKSRP